MKSKLLFHVNYHMSRGVILSGQAKIDFYITFDLPVNNFEHTWCDFLKPFSYFLLF